MPGVPFGRGLRLIESGGQRVVFVGSRALNVWDAADKAAERVAIVGLLQDKQAKQIELGPLLGYHRSTIGPLVERVEREGVAGVLLASQVPKARTR